MNSWGTCNLVSSFPGVALSVDCAELLRSSQWASWVESDNRDKGMMKWLFQVDYRDVLVLGTCSFLYVCLHHVDAVRLYSDHISLWCRYVNFVQNICRQRTIIHSVTVTWWWVLYRITAVAIVLRHPNDEEMKMQFRILMFGLIVEGSALCTFFALPILRRFSKKIPWHEKLWHSHLVSSIAMLVFWAMVLIVGFGEKLTPILYPCTNSKSSVCSILISYPG
jgi:hypothetical protein